jgi:hypothetical protein
MKKKPTKVKVKADEESKVKAEVKAEADDGATKGTAEDAEMASTSA